MIKLSAAQNLLKNAFRPILFSALGLHGLLLFTPLSSETQVKPKETAEPVKIKRLSDKVLVKSMPKVKVTTATKPSLPKVAVASSNPIVIKSPDTPPTPTPTSTPLPSPSASPSVSPSPTGTPAPTSTPTPSGIPTPDTPPNLDPESQKFASVIAGLRTALNPDEAAADADSGLLDDPKPFFNVKPSPQGNTLISNQDVADVVTNLSGQFTEKFTKKADYGGGELYEAKIGSTVRYISLIKANSGKSVMVFLWEKSPM